MKTVAGKTGVKHMHQNEELLRTKILNSFEESGFLIEGSKITPAQTSKTWIRKISDNVRREQLSKHKKFLNRFMNQAKNYTRNSWDINPANISLELRYVERNTFEESIFRWWDMVWWSIPYEHPCGRQMRFLLWDTGHDAPFGLIALQSPVLKMSVLDDYLDIPKEELDFWVNKSMSAHRVGALPPYNDLIGGKMAALALTSNEIRQKYASKYGTSRTINKERKLGPDLLFITTSSAFGKSSIYNRLKYRDELVAKNLGYTKGAGTFHIGESIYQELLCLLRKRGINISKGLDTGPSRKLKLVSSGLRELELDNFQYHGVRREFYLFPLVANLLEVIHNGSTPIWLDRPFKDLANFWKERWAILRAQKVNTRDLFSVQEFFQETKEMLEYL